MPCLNPILCCRKWYLNGYLKCNSQRVLAVHPPFPAVGFCEGRKTCFSKISWSLFKKVSWWFLTNMYLADISHIKNCVIFSRWMIPTHLRLKCSWNRCTHSTERQTVNLKNTSSLCIHWVSCYKVYLDILGKALGIRLLSSNDCVNINHR